MIDSAEDIARKLKRGAREAQSADKTVKRYWAGWRIFLSYGLENNLAAKAGIPYDENNVWHLSVSWNGGYPVEEARNELKQLVIRLGVPEDKREGFEVAKVAGSPQVTHWVWKDA